MIDLIKAKEELLRNGYTCVLVKGDDIIFSQERGVKPLVAWLDGAKDLTDYCAADKVIGKATAFLYVLLKVKATYACVISKSALSVLKAHNVKVEYDVLVENVINRKGDGICPFEEAVLGCDEPSVAYQIIKDKMRQLNILQ